MWNWTTVCHWCGKTLCSCHSCIQLELKYANTLQAKTTVLAVWLQINIVWSCRTTLPAFRIFYHPPLSLPKTLRPPNPLPPAPCGIHKAILLFFSPFSVVRPTKIFGIFKKRKSNDVVTPFFTWNNSFNLKNEHSDSIEKNRNKNMNIFHSILYILLIQICEC